MGSSTRLKRQKMAGQEQPEEVPLSSLTYRELQEMAISMGIKGNQSRENLEAAVRETQ